MHNLESLLKEAYKLLPDAPKGVIISWGTEETIGTDYWAWYWPKKEGKFLGLHPRLKRAPRFVVFFLVCHELLHGVFPCKGPCKHPKRFRVAERLLPKAFEAQAWLDKHYTDP